MIFIKDKRVAILNIRDMGGIEFTNEMRRATLGMKADYLLIPKEFKETYKKLPVWDFVFPLVQMGDKLIGKIEFY